MHSKHGTGIVKLEKVQRQAARFVHGNYSERDPGCLTQMVNYIYWLGDTRKQEEERQIDNTTKFGMDPSTTILREILVV